jgi:hypothetical protein
MKKTFIFCFILCSLSAFSQSVSYRIDPVADGSFYLVEIVQAAATAENPAPVASEYPQKFNTKEQLTAYIAYLRKQADDAKVQAKKLSEIAPRMEVAAGRIEAIASVYFAPKQEPVSQPIKPTKKKKKQ